jgi:hypothetical protein
MACNQMFAMTDWITFLKLKELFNDNCVYTHTHTYTNVWIQFLTDKHFHQLKENINSLCHRLTTAQVAFSFQGQGWDIPKVILPINHIPFHIAAEIGEEFWIHSKIP